MSDTTASLGRKLESARELQSVVRAMKAQAASSIEQYEQSARALGDYYRTVEMGLSLCLRQGAAPFPPPRRARGADAKVGAIVFGSDQGLVGQFNDVVVDFAAKALSTFAGAPQVWAVGERAQARLATAHLPAVGVFNVPHSVEAITLLVGQILVESEQRIESGEISALHLFHNRKTAKASYEPIGQRLLPLDEAWRRELTKRPWPSANLPEVIGDMTDTVRSLIRGYVFVSLFRACAESLAAENASRLAAMQRADKNIDELLERLNGTFHRLRQEGIDEELFDVVSGYQALSGESPPNL
jgi:F-type H+-transporting ATPase subunit gamma